MTQFSISMVTLAANDVLNDSIVCEILGRGVVSNYVESRLQRGEVCTVKNNVLRSRNGLGPASAGISEFL
jgi:hypothetical protein